MTNLASHLISRGRRAARGERGFTLIELLVVILIIGILASITLPAFLKQQLKGQDAGAKSNARNLVSQISACYEEVNGYVGCTARLTAAETGLPIGNAPGQVEITAESALGYEIVAYSRGVTGGARHTYTVTYDQATAAVHDCTVRDRGGCPVDGLW